IGVANAFGVSPTTILDWNDDLNPTMLKVGQTLIIPIPDGFIYKVNKGDNISIIAKRFFTLPDLIKKANSLTSDLIFPGQELFIPSEIMGLAFNDTKTFIWPVYGEISSPFGWRIHPITKKWSFHTGVDIAAPLGTPVFAAGSGIVEYAGWYKGYGNFILINHGKYKTAYGHLSKIDVFVGEYVRKGELIGRVGNTGISTGPHVHFEVRVSDKTVNPMAYLPSPGLKYVYNGSIKWVGGGE
ncbi:MAG: M23 family metallopeptidase, partial [Thermotogaceae bacterium]|nr:M23 family metallopeptidase [Thermotogaceae bacterium]